ncbi:MAG: hypothetical protein DWQ37_01345 [Planctomycetota bacterium]|nr:MAG: hypothetical protein DWQ37_01345 [Planctomycetota bacterium]
MGLALCFATHVAQAADVPDVSTPEAAFAALESLAGEWTNEKTPDAKPGMVIRTTGAGSAVQVTFFPDTPMEMLSLFHLDGPERLVHTHYCALQNQPTMELVKTDRPGVMRFEFVSGTNMDVDEDMHSHNTEIEILADGKFKAVVESWDAGKPAGKQEFTMQRRPEKKVAEATP